jgi:sensor histidine kinase regulating citrate/malate metabolism
VAKFNGRTRALVAVLDGLGAILGAVFIGLLLDKLPYARKTRGFIGVATIFLLGIAVWGGGLAFQLGVCQETFGWSRTSLFAGLVTSG